MEWKLWHVLSGLVVGAVVGFALGSLGGGDDQVVTQASGTTQAPAGSASTVPGSPATGQPAASSPGGGPGPTGAPTTTPPATQPTTTLPKPTHGFGNGVFEVGTDVEPGMYRTAGPTADSEFCFWSRLSGLGGDPDIDVITNGAQDGPFTVTIEGSDVGFESASCEEWSPA